MSKYSKKQSIKVKGNRRIACMDPAISGAADFLLESYQNLYNC